MRTHRANWRGESSQLTELSTEADPALQVSCSSMTVKPILRAFKQGTVYYISLRYTPRLAVGLKSKYTDWAVLDLMGVLQRTL